MCEWKDAAGIDMRMATRGVGGEHDMPALRLHAHALRPQSCPQVATFA
jgi:hypothetical protein